MESNNDSVIVTLLLFACLCCYSLFVLNFTVGDRSIAREKSNDVHCPYQINIVKTNEKSLALSLYIVIKKNLSCKHGSKNNHTNHKKGTKNNY